MGETDIKQAVSCIHMSLQSVVRVMKENIVCITGMKDICIQENFLEEVTYELDLEECARVHLAEKTGNIWRSGKANDKAWDCGKACCVCGGGGGRRACALTEIIA